MGEPQVVVRISALRDIIGAWRRENLRIGMIPTMGALHEGHLSLVREARRRTERVIVTLFVNPAQFAATEDLGAYPRALDADLAKLAEVRADILFAPELAEIYPADFDTRVSVGGPSAGLETDFRAHFFGGVTTVVTKLLLIGLPDEAYFGEKDFQQLLVVRKLVRDLDVPTAIVGCPTVREPDGLAMSSRNAYLDAADRARAPRLHAILQAIAAGLRAGTDAAAELARGRTALTEAGFDVDYLDLRDAETLAPRTDAVAGPARLLAAARLGSTRLIDNVAV